MPDKRDGRKTWLVVDGAKVPAVYKNGEPVPVEKAKKQGKTEDKGGG